MHLLEAIFSLGYGPLVRLYRHVQCNEGASPSAIVWLVVVFLINFIQQWVSMAQKNKLYQALATNTILGSRINLLFK